MRSDTKIADIELLEIFGEELAKAGYFTINDIVLGGVERFIFSVNHRISILDSLVSAVINCDCDNEIFLGEYYQDFHKRSREEQKDYLLHVVTELYQKKLQVQSVDTVVEALDLGVSAYNVLKRSGYNAVKDILDQGFSELVNTQGMTEPTLEEILIILSKSYDLTSFVNDYLEEDSCPAVINGIEIEPMLRRIFPKERIALSRYDSIDKLELSTELRECLTRYGINTIGDFLECPEYERIQIRGVGQHWLECEELVNSLENDANGIFRLLSWEEEDELQSTRQQEPIPALEFHMWINKSNYFTRAKLYKEGSESRTYRARSICDSLGTLIYWESLDEDNAYYPLRVVYTKYGEIDFGYARNTVVAGAKGILISGFTESVNTYVIHNNSFNSIKVHGFKEIPPGKTLKFSETDCCGEHLDGFSVVGHGIVVSATESRYSEFLEKPGTIEKVTDRIWHFYTDKGFGGFRKGDFLLRFVDEHITDGNLLTLRERIFEKEQIIRILLDDRS